MVKILIIFILYLIYIKYIYYFCSANFKNEGYETELHGQT